MKKEFQSMAMTMLIPAVGLTISTFAWAQSSSARKDDSVAVQIAQCPQREALTTRAARAGNRASETGWPTLGPGESALAMGMMHEQGVCLAKSWERAGDAYEVAHNQGVGAARARLVNLYAEERRDIGAALWWAQKDPRKLPAECRQESASPEAFVAALKAQSGAWVLGCLQVARAVAQMEIVLETYLDGGVTPLAVPMRLRFRPSDGSWAWLRTDTGERFEAALGTELASLTPTFRGAVLGAQRSLGAAGSTPPSLSLGDVTFDVRLAARVDEPGFRLPDAVVEKAGQKPQVRRELEFVR